MKILLCGASGFVGRHLEAALRNAGHEVVRGVRHPQRPGDIAVDYLHDTDTATWLPRLAGIEAVINAVGVLRDSTAQPMAKLLDATPRALFAAAAQAGVQRIVQISALGVGTGIPVPYMQTREAADEFLQTLDLDWAILRPSLIYGEDGASTRMFLKLARLPFVLLPYGGAQSVQPVHIDDIAQAVARLLDPATGRPPLRSVIECVNAESVTLAGLISSYATQQGRRAPIIRAMPTVMLNAAAWVGDRIRSLPLGSDTLAMLESGYVGNGTQFAALLGRAPRSYREFLHDAH